MSKQSKKYIKTCLKDSAEHKAKTVWNTYNLDYQEYHIMNNYQEKSKDKNFQPTYT